MIVFLEVWAWGELNFFPLKIFSTQYGPPIVHVERVGHYSYNISKVLPPIPTQLESFGEKIFSKFSIFFVFHSHSPKSSVSFVYCVVKNEQQQQQLQLLLQLELEPQQQPQQQQQQNNTNVVSQPLIIEQQQTGLLQSPQFLEPKQQISTVVSSEQPQQHQLFKMTVEVMQRVERLEQQQLQILQSQERLNKALNDILMILSSKK